MKQGGVGQECPVGYLDQHTVLEKGMTIRDVLKSAFAWLFELEEQMNGICDKMGEASEEELTKMMEELGSTFDAYEVCLVKPGSGPFFEYANKNFPVHSGCPIIAGITKCIEAEANLALKADASIKFLDNE